MKKNLSEAFEKEIRKQSYQNGYDQGISDALVTIQSILKHNDMRMNAKEFWIEYNHLKEEGKLQ